MSSLSAIDSELHCDMRVSDALNDLVIGRLEKLEAAVDESGLASLDGEGTSSLECQFGERYVYHWQAQWRLLYGIDQTHLEAEKTKWWLDPQERACSATATFWRSVEGQLFVRPVLEALSGGSDSLSVDRSGRRCCILRHNNVTSTL